MVFGTGIGLGSDFGMRVEVRFRGWGRGLVLGRGLGSSFGTGVGVWFQSRGCGRVLEQGVWVRFWVGVGMGVDWCQISG